MKLRVSQDLHTKWRESAETLQTTMADYLRRAIRGYFRVGRVAEPSEVESATSAGVVISVDGIEEDQARCRMALRWATAVTISRRPVPVAIDAKEAKQQYQIVEALG